MHADHLAVPPRDDFWIAELGFARFPAFVPLLDDAKGLSKLLEQAWAGPTPSKVLRALLDAHGDTPAVRLHLLLVAEFVRGKKSGAVRDVARAFPGADELEALGCRGGHLPRIPVAALLYCKDPSCLLAMDACHRWHSSRRSAMELSGPLRKPPLPLVELETRWEVDSSHRFAEYGIDETMSIDRSKHSVFGASKVAADVMVQEYGRYFGMKTCCLRGGCLTGPHHSGVELHGFLSYLVKVNVEGGLYRVFGYKGKQVRDNIHAFDVARFIERFIEAPRCGEVYNLGGGRGNSVSILEAFARVEALTGKPMRWEYVEKNREGDHMCYISDLSKMKKHYPGWGLSKSLDDIFFEIVEGWIAGRGPKTSR